MSNSLWPHELQHARPPCPSPTPGVHSNSHPSSRWCHPAISPSVIPFSSCSQSPQHQSLFQWVNSSHEGAKVLEIQLQHHSLQKNPRADLLQNGLVGSPCSPRDFQEFSPAPQFKSINSSVLSFLYSPTLTSIRDHKKTLALTRWSFVVKVMALLFNVLSRLVITFLLKATKTWVGVGRTTWIWKTIKFYSSFPCFEKKFIRRVSDDYLLYWWDHGIVVIAWPG